MTPNEIVNLYMEHRKTQTVAAAAAATMARCSIAPSILVDVFSAAQLDGSRPDQEAAVILVHRNELLSHFNSQQ